ncbi:PREDICTED: CMRF35-like molecule 1 [Miniopterus natalensis]|uniref:CMRF35-like molecule 1 n=1 Tax=Miniopterus natalensis TaxID=291302 RepID=UPI0007A71461|nr:PREDICTED: CMRF35-like molecule 1 [Miniopterus natalensis]
METHLLLLFPLLLPGSGSSDVITGPGEVRGLEQGSLTMQCRYVTGWETHVKWWCQGADWKRCRILVKTNGSEQEVKKDRVSIRDNQRNRTITVTMTELRQEDTDIYWCGIEKVGTDRGVQVRVTIDAVPVTLESATESPAVTDPDSDTSDGFMNLSILLPLLFALLLLLLVAASLLAWRMVKRQKKAAGISPEQVSQLSENDVYYANLTLQKTGASSGSSREKPPSKFPSSAQEDQVEVEYITMDPFPKEDISYAALTLDTLGQDSVYMNTGDLVTNLPSRSQEELTQYSTIRKP